MMSTIDVGRSSGPLANNATARTNRLAALSQAGASTLSGPNRMRSEMLGGSRYSKVPLAEASVAFKIGPGSEIPSKEVIRTGETRAERQYSLQRVPAHKPIINKFSGDPGTRTIAPLTYEDLGHFPSLSLISTLREAVSVKPNTNNYQAPPSFFDDDQSKWEKKFAPAVADRANIKKTLQKTVDLNARNVVNNNVSPDSTFFDVERKLRDETLYTGGQIKPT